MTGAVGGGDDETPAPEAAPAAVETTPPAETQQVTAAPSQPSDATMDASMDAFGTSFKASSQDASSTDATPAPAKDAKDVNKKLEDDALKDMRKLFGFVQKPQPQHGLFSVKLFRGHCVMHGVVGVSSLAVLRGHIVHRDGSSCS